MAIRSFNDFEYNPGSIGIGRLNDTATLQIEEASINPNSGVSVRQSPITSGGTGTTIIKGCTDPVATNFNKFATQNDGTCVYTPPSLPVVQDSTRNISFTFNTKGNLLATIFVDGVAQNNTKIGLTFNEKELLTPKEVTISVNDRQKSNETYRIKTVQRSIEKDIQPVLDKDFDDPIVVRDFEDRIKFQDDVDFRPERKSSIVNPALLNLSSYGNSQLPQFDYDRPSTGISFGIDKYTPPVGFKKPKISFGKFTWTYYELIVEKKLGSGEYESVSIPQPTSPQTTDIAIFSKSTIVPLYFTFNTESTDILIKDLIKSVDEYVINIQGDLASNDIIQYETSEGETGFVSSTNLKSIKFAKFGKASDRVTQPYIKFSGVGITDYTHKVSYKYENRNNNNKSIDGLSATFLLEPGDNLITVLVSKNSVLPSPTSPTLRVDTQNVVFNIANSETVSVSYSTQYADRVIYTLGNVEREISPSGVITLKNEDFSNGVGRYVLYLQPISNRGGSGELQKVVINVQSKAWLPGPDITHINYPQNIKGADFKEYNVNFDVSWQSVNTNYILIYAEKVTDKNFLKKVPPAGNTTFNVSEILRTIGSDLVEDRDKSVFKLLFVPYNEEGDERTLGKTEEATITFDKGDLKLRRGSVINDFKQAFISNLNPIGFEDFTSPLLTHYLHIGDGDNKLIATWGIDDVTFSEQYRDEETNQIKYRNVEKSLVLKLYEPLPSNITTNDSVWISKVHSIPLVDQITILDDITTSCTPLTPNFDLELGDDIGYQILDDLISSGSTTSNDIVNQFISSSGISIEKLDIEFVSQSSGIVENGTGLLVEKINEFDYNWKEFVKYSSAEERARNFYYKVQLIEHYQSKYNLVTSGSGEWTGSVSVLNEANKYIQNISEVKNGFDAFEKYLYTTSGSLTYPGAGQNELSASTDSSAISWFAGIVNSAEEYDFNNTSRFVYNLPEHIRNDENSSEFMLFFDMVGQHFDILWSYIRNISKTRNVEHKKDIGISNDLIYHMLESLGWNANMGVKSQFLWEYAFGKHLDGTEVSTMSGKDRQNQIWRRLLNNLPYLYKHKGTKRALHAAMSCYGVPASLLTIMEFGGPKDPTTSGTTKFSFEDRTASINISGSSAILVPWKQFTNEFSTDYPNSIEIRLNTDQRQDQEIISGSEWSLHLLKEVGSLAKLELRVMSGSTLVSSSTDSGSFFNDEYTHIVINKETSGGNDVFTFYAKEAFQERLRTNVSGSLTISGVSGWTSGSEIKIGGSTLTASIDEFRLWRTPLSESRIDNHTLLPDAIDGNHISASTTDLIVRTDFEYPINVSVGTSSIPSGSIKNVSLIDDYTLFVTASNFENVSEYPYQYTPYDRTVTADVPSSGFNVGNKVRFESQTKVLDLSYRNRATKKSYDQAPIDTDRLGLFFSPIKEINMDILKSLGSFNIDNYIGDPGDEYSDEYGELKKLRNYYFQRYDLNLYEYIQLVRYIDKSLFDTLESLVPARAKVSSGLLIEPHILERSKTKWKRPSGETKDYHTTINVEQDVNVSSTNPQYTMSLDTQRDISLSVSNPQFESRIDVSNDTNLFGYTNDYSTTINAETDINLIGEITRNSGSDMGGISITIDAKITGSVSGQYDSTKFQQVGMEPDSISRLGFGLYGENGNAQRTYFDQFGNIQKDRVKVYLLKQSYTEDVPVNINQYDSSRGTELETVTKFRYKVNILPFTGSDGNETSSSIGGDIVEVTPLNGYFPLHYRNVGDLTTGLENSYFRGSKQTALTTPDGGDPVVTFTTNPNTLRVSDTGRGSGEPILQVD